jgi:uncharacterized protein YacL
MRHRINEWVQRLLVPGLVIATLVLLRLGFTVSKILTIILPIFLALLVLVIVVDPGPRAKELLESLRSRR